MKIALDVMGGDVYKRQMFDCVMPTRLARHGVALTPDGPMHIKNQRWATDSRPIDPEGHPHATRCV